MSEASAPMAEEVEVTIQEAQSNAQAANIWFVDNMRRLLMAGLGAFALSFDEAEKFVGKLVERGELAQKDAEKILSDVQARVTPARPPVAQVSERVESGVEEFLNRLNIPSKRDIDDLSAKIAQLSARVEELRRTQG
jgi:poly(hydroxyalkanoate) granule-associated protein